MAGYILYQTSTVMRDFPPTHHVAAALMLFEEGRFALNDPIGSNATGQMVKITTQGHWVHGYADEIGVSGQVVSYSPCAPFQLP